MSRSSKDVAAELKDVFTDLSPLIQHYTAKVCPECARVCCIDRHGTHDPWDIAFLEALGEGLPPGPPLSVDTLPCRHIGPRGCTIERHMRPYRCTWYFCDALLKHMPDDMPRRYRELVRLLGRLAALRQELLETSG